MAFRESCERLRAVFNAPGLLNEAERHLREYRIIDNKKSLNGRKIDFIYLAADFNVRCRYGGPQFEGKKWSIEVELKRIGLIM